MAWKTSKTSQNNPRSHYSEQNLIVYSSIGPGSASLPIEFELTRHQHLQDPRAELTLTVMFKDPPDGLLGEAWRILLAATEGKELFPAHVQQYWKKHVAQWEGREAASDSNPGAPATDPPPLKSRSHTGPYRGGMAKAFYVSFWGRWAWLHSCWCRRLNKLGRLWSRVEAWYGGIWRVQVTIERWQTDSDGEWEPVEYL